MSLPNFDTNSQNFSNFVSGDKKELVFHDNIVCFICECFVTEPYIRCAKCVDIVLCTHCFASGKEKDEHENNHDYTVVQNDFPIVEDSQWSAKEEKNLLSLMEFCGFENWTNISKKLPGRSPEDCKKHYLKNYIDNPCLPDLPKIKSKVDCVDSQPVPYAFTLKNLDKPPRYLFENPNYNFTSGYNAARSDFETNHDNDAELIVSKLKYKDFCYPSQDCKLGQALQLALFDCYNMRLKERARRKKVVRDHGLISIRKGAAHLMRYSTQLPVATLEKFLIFSQLLKGIEFDAIMICFHKIGTLKNYIRELKNYRVNGLRNFHDIPLFKELSNFKKESDKLKKLYPAIENFDTDTIVIPTAKNPIVFGNSFRRRKAAPLEIHPGMVGYRDLTEDERKLCSEIRIEPKFYIEYKNQLRNENEKNGPVKLAKARTLLKIDVNKTKQIYEFLGNKGYITTQ